MAANFARLPKLLRRRDDRPAPPQPWPPVEISSRFRKFVNRRESTLIARAILYACNQSVVVALDVEHSSAAEGFKNQERFKGVFPPWNSVEKTRKNRKQRYFRIKTGRAMSPYRQLLKEIRDLDNFCKNKEQRRNREETGVAKQPESK